MADPSMQIRINGTVEYDAGRKINRNTDVLLQCTVTIKGDEATIDALIASKRETKRVSVRGISPNKIKKFVEDKARDLVKKKMLPNGVTIRKFPRAQ